MTLAETKERRAPYIGERMRPATSPERFNFAEAVPWSG